MSRGDDIVGINWGSSQLRAYRIGADGAVLDEFAGPLGVASLDRDGMASAMAVLAERWPDRGPVYAAGMIGSNVGWAEAPYIDAPATASAIADALLPARIGPVDLGIVPGVACRRVFDGAPDIMRGEEVELLGLAALRPGFTGLAILPGTHTKWTRLVDGAVTDFFTAMSGEVFDRLTAAGLLRSVVEGEAVPGPAFAAGVEAAMRCGLNLGTLLFGVRARVIRGDLARCDAGSYARGLLIGAELADAQAALGGPGQGPVPLVGNRAQSALYAAALADMGVPSTTVDSRDACVAGFLALHRAAA